MFSVIRFDSYEVDLDARELRKDGVRIHLRDQSFQVLATLLNHRGELVSREQLRQQLWREDVFVDFENGLNTAVARLREALGDLATHPRYIETLPRRGYRFVAAATEDNRARGRASSANPRLLVLPPVNLTGDPAQEYFADAIIDDLITEVASEGRGWLSVIARTTAMRYRATKKDVATMGRELNLDYVVESSLRRADGHVTINVQLIRTRDEVHVFAHKFQAELSDLFRLETEVARSILAHLPGLVPAPVATQPKAQPTVDLVAYQLYLQGRHEMFRQTPDAFMRAKQLFEGAVSRDQHFALAYYALGELSWWAGFFGLRPPKEAFTAALLATLRALDIDNNLGEAHGLLAKLRHHLDFNWTEVNRELAHAMNLNPVSSVVRFFYATSGFIPQGRIAECIAELEKALDVDPLSMLLRSWLTVALWLARDYDRAMGEAKRVESLEPASYLAHIGIGNIYRELGKYEEAIACHRRALSVSGGSPQLLGWLGLDLGLNGNQTEARLILDQLQSVSAKAYVSPTSFAWVHLGLNEVDATFEWMDKAIDERDPNINPIKTFPFLDSIRNDPRFPDLLTKMNLA